MRLFKPAAVCCGVTGILLVVVIIGVGGGLTYYLSRALQNITEKQAKKIVEKVLELNFTLPDISRDIPIPAQEVAVTIDAAQLTQPILNALARVNPFVELPVINNTLQTTVTTPELSVAITVEGLSYSFATLLGAEIVNQLNDAPELSGEVVWYLSLAIGVLFTILLANATLDKILVSSIGLGLKGAVNTEADAREKAVRP